MKYFSLESFISPYLFHRSEGGFTGFWKNAKNYISPVMGLPVCAIMGAK